MTKFLIVALFCAPGWLFGGVVRYHAPTRHPTPTARPTATPLPTMTPLPTSTPTATALPQPTATPDCWADYDRCLLGLLNSERQNHNEQPLSLNPALSACALTHSIRMAIEGYLSHDGFPSPDVCISAAAAGQNVGLANGTETVTLQAITDQMMSEPWTPGCIGSHVCNILSATFHQVGIGIDRVGNVTWVTETFTD